MIRLENVSKTIDGHLLFEGIDLALADGHIYQFQAPNGWGKSVLLRMIGGLDRHYQGEIKNDQDPKTTLFLTDSGIGLPYLSIADNIRLSADILGGTIDMARASLLFGGDQHLLNQDYQDSSLGNQNKVGLALLASQQAYGLTILDEALNGIDQNSLDWIWYRLTERAEAGQGPIILVSHAEDFSRRDFPVEKIALERWRPNEPQS
ncbi:ATP-binding cassette domain-containing protein [Lactobacillaceae bacterium L1_55_11]|nr:ATP-binding cassette domain-containing protein [Lactobacillaceae bacterium L1_55_11]